MTNRATRRSRRLEVGIAVVLFTLSVGVRLVHHAETEVDQPLRADALNYFITAKNLSVHGVYSRDTTPSSEVAPERRTQLQPGYPLLLSFLIGQVESIDELLDWVVLLQALLGALVPVLTYVLARTALPMTASMVAGLLVALSPHLIAIEAFVLTDAIFSFGLVLSLLLFVYARRSQGAWLALAAGIALGLTQLVREVATPIPLLLAPLFFLNWRKAADTTRRAIVRRAGALLLGAAIIWVPQQTVLAMHSAGHPVEEVNSPWLLFVHGSFVDLAHETDPARRPLDFERLSRDSDYGAPVLWARFRDDPLPTLGWYLGRKALFLFRWDNLYNGGVYQYPMVRMGFDAHASLRALRGTMHWLHWPLHALALLSLPLLLIDLRRGRRDEFDDLAMPLLVVIFYHAILLSVFMPVPRYSIPLRAFVFVLAIGVLVRAWRSWNVDVGPATA